LSASPDLSIDFAAARSAARFGRGRTRLVLPRLPAAWAHTIRAVLAVWLALYLAYSLQLDSPYSAATTALIVVHPVRGGLFSKSVWRVFGTLLGAIAAVTLVAAFPQQPVLFLLGVSVWLGIFTFVASLLRHFRAYGAVLAGYTVGLIAFGALDHPDTIVNLALARVAVVTIGVLSAAFVSMLFHGSIGRVGLRRRMASLTGRVARLLRSELQGQPTRPDQTSMTLDLGGIDLGGIDEIIEFASVETFDISRRSNTLRVGIAELFNAFIAGRHTIRMVRDAAAHAPDDAAAGAGDAAMDDVLTRLIQFADTPDTGKRRDLLRTMRAVQDELDTLMRGCPCGADVMALAQLRELVVQLSRAVSSIDTDGDEPRAEPIRLRTDLNWHMAFRNGLRAMIAMGLGSVFWIVTAWPSGGAMLEMLAVICGLLASSPSAGAASVDFAKGMVLSALLAFICVFGMLTNVTGFPLLALSLLPFIAGGAYASTKPHLNPIAIPFLIFFMTLVGATNPMHYDLLSFVNNAFAFVCAAVCAVFAFRIILPPDPALHVRRLSNAIGRDVQRLSRSGPAPDRVQWEHRQHQRLTRLAGWLQAAGGAHHDAVLEAASAAMTVGSAAIQVRATLAAGTLSEPVASAAEGGLRLLRDLRSNPGVAATRATELSRLLSEESVGSPHTNELARVAAAFQRIGTLLQRHQRFFQRDGVTC
jgi:uncharacterized membrane protein YccC